VRLLVRFNIEVALGQLGRSGPLQNEIQRQIIGQIISVKRLRQFRERFGDIRVDERPLMHHAQILTMLRLVIAFGDPVGGNALLARDDFDAIGELALTVNSLFDFGAIATLKDELAVAKQVASELGPGFEVGKSNTGR
jgi:hypothetical protein